MKFRASRPLTLGVELELMLLDARSGRLKSAAAPVLAEAKNSAFGSVIKAEITQAMIEVNSGVHIDGDALASDLLEVCRVLASAARRHGVRICGGGAHPFRDWPSRDVFPQPRFQALEKTYGYLARKRPAITSPDQCTRPASAGFQRCGSSSSRRCSGVSGSRSSTSRRYA